MAIDSISSVYALAVTNVFPTPIVLDGFTADDPYENGPITTGETMMGLNGRMAAGMVWEPTEHSLIFLADSPSVELFEKWQEAQISALTTFAANATLRIKATGRVYTCINGIMVGYTSHPTARRILQGRRFTIRWERISPSPI